MFAHGSAAGCFFGLTWRPRRLRPGIDFNPIGASLISHIPAAAASLLRSAARC